MRYSLAGTGDDPEIRALLRDAPMAGDIQVGFEREPDSHLAATIEGDVHQTLTVRDEEGALAAIGSRAVRDAWVAGEVVRLGYLSQMRVAQGFRGRPGLLRRGYGAIEELHRAAADNRFYVSTVLADNLPARRLLERGLRGFPEYKAAGELVTLVVPLHRSMKFRDQVRATPATKTELPAVIACLERFGARHRFSPAWNLDDLECSERTRNLQGHDFLVVRRGDDIVGCVAVWDQRAFKQSVIRGYSRGYGWLRPVINLLAPWLRTHSLPPVGQALKNAYLSHLAVDNDDPEVLRALLAAAHGRARSSGLESLTFSLGRGSGLLPAVQQMAPYREYVSVVYTVAWEDGEVAAAAARADTRPVHLDVAVL